MTEISKLKDKWLKSSEFKKCYEEQSVEFELAREFIRARINSGKTQEEIAELMKTSQSAVARLESGTTLPTMKTIKKFSDALGIKFEFHFIL